MVSISIEDLIIFKKVNKSYKTIIRIFHKYLDKIPFPQKPLTLGEVIYLKIDGTYFGKWGCLIVCKNQYGKFIFWDFIPYEMYFKYKEDLLIIKNWYNIQGVTSDWQGGLVKAVKEVFPNIPHQRCLVHTQRRCESLLTQTPKIQAGVDLLKIVKRLNRIRTINESKKWFYRIYAWGFKYEYLINQRTYDTKEDGSKTWWYTHKKLRGSYRTIITSRDNLFLYLGDKNISKDTNGLEVEFKHLKNKIRKHTALTKRRKVCLMFWYLYLKNLQRN